MERDTRIGGTAKPYHSGHSEQSTTDLPAGSIESVLTDAALNELKNQSVNGCLLCSLEAWDEQEWD